MTKSLILLGAGGFAREAVHWIDRNIYDPVGFYVDEEGPKPPNVHLPVIRDLGGFKDVHFLAVVGDPVGRQLLSKRAILAGLKPCQPVIHDRAVVGKAHFGRNVIICPGVVITSDVFVANGALLNLNCTIGHDVVIDEYVTISPGVNVSGHVRIGMRSYLGTNSSVRERVKIGHDCFLGMGAALVKDMPDGEVWTGVPARKK